MAIIKHAKNMRIEVLSDYDLSVGGIFEKTAEKLNAESLKKNLTMISNKQINARGDKK